MERGARTGGMHFHVLFRLNNTYRVSIDLKRAPGTSEELVAQVLKDSSFAEDSGFYLQSQPVLEFLLPEGVDKTAKYLAKSFESCHENGRFFDRIRFNPSRILPPPQ